MEMRGEVGSLPRPPFPREMLLPAPAEGFGMQPELQRLREPGDTGSTRGPSLLPEEDGCIPLDVRSSRRAAKKAGCHLPA